MLPNPGHTAEKVSFYPQTTVISATDLETRF